MVCSAFFRLRSAVRLPFRFLPPASGALTVSVLSLLSSVLSVCVAGAVPSAAAVRESVSSYVPGLPVPDDYDKALGEANDLYVRLVGLLRRVDSPERYRAVRDSVALVWRGIAGLESRYPDLDPTTLSDRLFDDEEFMRLGREFDDELVRLRKELPEVAAELGKLIEKEVNAGMNEETVAGFDRMMDLYEELIAALERVETARDALDSFDTLHALALRLKGAEDEFGDMRDEFHLMAPGSERAHALMERLEAVFAEMDGSSGMEPVFDALEPLAGDHADDDHDPDEPVPTPEEEKAMEDYRVALAAVIELFRKIRTAADVETYADEIRSLRDIDREFEARLAGQRGERLVESNPKLVPLLMEMGEEQMRIAKDPELSAALSILLEE